MSYLDLAASLVKTLEGCRLIGYLDSVGKPTNGYGHTGPEVRLGASISQEIADHDLAVDLATADARLAAVCRAGTLVDLCDHERAALVSFVFNVGADPKWTIWKDVQSGNLKDVPAQLRRFVNGRINGKEQVIMGLEHRREAEIVFWNTADLQAAAAVTQTANAITPPPSGLTRAIVTPPTPLAAPPLAKTSLAVKAGTAIAGMGAVATQLHGVVAPHADESPIFQHAAVFLTGGIILASAAGVLIHVGQAQARAT